MDPFSFFSGLFSTGADLWMNEKNNDLQEYLAGQQMKFQHNEAELARQWQEQMQDKMNNYNSPQAQMQRMVEAGLNPYLLSGSQLVGEATAATPPSGAQAGSTSLPQTHAGYIDPLLAAQISNINSQTEKNISELPVLQQKVVNMRAELKNINESTKLISAQVDTESSKQELNRQLGAESAQKVVNMVTENQQLIESFEHRMAALDASTLKDQKQAELFNLQASNYLRELESRLAVNRATIVELMSRKDLNEQQESNLKAIESQINELTRGIEIANDIKSETGKAQAYVDMISKGVSTIADCVNIIKVFVPKSKRSETINTDGSGVITNTSSTTTSY